MTYHKNHNSSSLFSEGGVFQKSEPLVHFFKLLFLNLPLLFPTFRYLMDTKHCLYIISHTGSTQSGSSSSIFFSYVVCLSVICLHGICLSVICLHVICLSYTCDHLLKQPLKCSNHILSDL